MRTREYVEVARTSELKKKCKSLTAATIPTLVALEVFFYPVNGKDPLSWAIVAMILSISIARILHIHSSRHSPIAWQKKMAWLSFLAASAWGTYFFQAARLGHNNLPLQMMALMTCSGLTAVGTYSLAIEKNIFRAYFTPLFIAIGAIFLITAQTVIDHTFEIGLLVVLYFIGIQQGKSIERGWARSKRHAFELQSMIDLFPGGILVASGGAVIRANESFQTMFHLETQSQILTRLMSSPEFAARFQQFEAETQKSRTDFEAAILLPSGKRTFWFLLVKADEMTPEQNEVIVVALDVQAKKDAESQIESQRMKLETNARLATLGEIAGNVAHEINNPLFVISSRAQLMLLKMEKGSENEKMLRTHLDAILATCDRVVKIVRGLKSVSRNSENEAFERTSLKTVIDQTIDLCSSRISQTGAKIEVDDISQHLQVEIRPVQLSQVFLNLLNNAFDAIEGSESPWIKVGVHFSKTEFEVSVMDSGEGFPKELRHRMMDPFFSTKAPGKGTGLGLSISLRIVKAHQGELFLDESSPHTKFVARLPLEQKCLVGQAL